MKPKANAKPEQQLAPPSTQEAAQRMRQQFATTGTVQPRDMAVVFGNPAEGIQVTLKTGANSSHWKTL